MCSIATKGEILSDENFEIEQCFRTYGSSVKQQDFHGCEGVEQGHRFHPKEHNNLGKITMIRKEEEKETKSRSCESNSKVLAIKAGSLYSIRVQLYKNDAIVSRVNALLDTGSPQNLMAYKFYEDINHRFNLPLTPTKVKLVSVTDNRLICKGQLSITLKIGGVEKKVSFVVVDKAKFTCNLLIGSPTLEEFPMIINIPLRKAYVNNDNRTEVVPLSVVSGDIPIIPHKTKEAVMDYDTALKNAFENEQERNNVQMIQSEKHLYYPRDNNWEVYSSKHLPKPLQGSEEPIYSEREIRELHNRYLVLKGEPMEEEMTTFTNHGKADMRRHKTRFSNFSQNSEKFSGKIKAINGDLSLSELYEEFPHLSQIEKTMTSTRFNNYCVNTMDNESEILHHVSSKQRFTRTQNLYSNKIEGLMGKVQGNTDYIVYPCQNRTLYPNSRQIISVTVKSRVGTTPPEKTEIVTHSRSNFLETKEVFFANTLSTVENGCVLIDIINMGNSYINLYTSDMLATACVLESAETEDDMQRVGVVTESKGLTDKQLKDAYEEILLQNAEGGDDAQVLQTPEQLDDILDFLMQYKEIVSLDEDPAGICPLHTFKIQLKKDAPQVIHQGQYRQVHRHLQDIDEWVEDGLRKDYIEKSFSIHNIPLVVIPKRKGKPRICLDLRLLNKHIFFRIVILY